MHESHARLLDTVRNVDCEYRFYSVFINSKIERNE